MINKLFDSLTLNASNVMSISDFNKIAELPKIKDLFIPNENNEGAFPDGILKSFSAFRLRKLIRKLGKLIEAKSSKGKKGNGWDAMFNSTEPCGRKRFEELPKSTQNKILRYDEKYSEYDIWYLLRNLKIKAILLTEGFLFELDQDLNETIWKVALEIFSELGLSKLTDSYQQYSNDIDLIEEIEVRLKHEYRFEYVGPRLRKMWELKTCMKNKIKELIAPNTINLMRLFESQNELKEIKDNFWENNDLENRKYICTNESTCGIFNVIVFSYPITRN